MKDAPQLWGVFVIYNMGFCHFDRIRRGGGVRNLN